MSERLTTEPTIRTRIVDLVEAYRFRPHTSNFAIDLVFLVVLICLEETLVSSVLGPHLTVDLLTVWVACSVLQKQAGPAFVYAVCAALMQESRTSTPAGTYVCAYWILSILIVHFRPVLSWRFFTPWMAMFFAANILVITMSLLVVFVSSSYANFTFWHLVSFLFRIAVGLGFGVYISKDFIGPYSEEPIPQ